MLSQSTLVSRENARLGRMPRPTPPGLTRPATGAIDGVAERVALHLESLVPRGRARCLKVGEGEAALAEAIKERAVHSVWRYVDRESSPMPHDDGEFDVALLLDELSTGREAPHLLAEAARVAEFVVVKDRFTAGAQRLTRAAFVQLAAEQGLHVTAIDCGLAVDAPPARTGRAQPALPFVAVLRRA